MSGESDFYLCLFFDVNRGGFFDVAEKILSYLDYKSFVQFKQSCKMVYDFIKTSNIEQVQSYLAVKFIKLRTQSSKSDCNYWQIIILYTSLKLE